MVTKRLQKEDYPFLLRQVTRLPKHMDMLGELPPDHYKFLCVVGSRHCSDYGKEACRKLISGLRGYPVVIVSGLAIGIDSEAHEAALEAGLKCLALPGSGLSSKVLYPSSKRKLAVSILEAGGSLLSPFGYEQEGSFWTFPERNRLMAGISHATLVVEARKKSGTWTTIEAALKFGRDVLIVPGSIFSELSVKPLSLLKDGAKPVTSSEDILETLGFVLPEKKSAENAGVEEVEDSYNSPTDHSLSDEERKIVERVRAPVARDDLIRELALPPGYVNSVLVELEMKGLIAERQGLLTVK